MPKWTANNIPPLDGLLAVVTGTGCLGFETALALAKSGSEVILAGRDERKGKAAAQVIQRTAESNSTRFESLDLADLASIRQFAASFSQRHKHLDLLVNNAGVMVPPRRLETRDGFELQFGINHLGHFALSAALIPLLRASTRPRVVSVSSIAARRGDIEFHNLQSEIVYKPMLAYSQSKLANLLFALELRRRSDAAGWGISSIPVHPGISRRQLLYNAPGRSSLNATLRTLLWFLFQPAHQGALPSLFAATSPDARSGQYYGPDRLGETRGYPALAALPPKSTDPATAARLWQISEQLTGFSFQD